MSSEKKQPPFMYDVDLSKEISDGKGGMVLRYGRLRDSAFRHMGNDAPFRADGALYDLLSPGTPVMPINVNVGDIAVAPGTKRVKMLPERLEFCHRPGVSVYGD